LNPSLSQDPNLKAKDSDDEDSVKDIILKKLKDREVLMVLDNAEDPLANDFVKFTAELEDIIDFCKKVKVLLTSRKALKKLGEHIEVIYTLELMSKDSALKLLISKSPRKIKNDEIKELLDCPIPEESKIGQSLNLQIRLKPHEKNLIDHPFTSLLGGHPQAISLAAPLLRDNSLKELFIAFCNSNVMDVIDDCSNMRNSQTSLRVSLELSIDRVRQKNTNVLDFFGLVGLLPGGASKEELNELWGNTSWAPLKDELLDASLLTCKSGDTGYISYSMLPFMSVRAYEHLEQIPELKQEYHLKCCRLFKNYCYEFYNSEKSIEDVEGLVSIETNIWACIYRALNQIKNIEYQDPNLLSLDSTTAFTPYETLGGPVEETKRQMSLDSLSDENIKSLIFDEELCRGLSPVSKDKNALLFGMLILIYLIKIRPREVIQLLKYQEMRQLDFK
jgi:hypothetical protein